MRTGEVEANLIRLNESAKLSFLDELVQLKLEGPEKGQITGVEVSFHESQQQRLVGELEEAYKLSLLPEIPSSRAALNDFLIRVRLSCTG